LKQGVGVYGKFVIQRYVQKNINAVCGYNVEFQNIKPDVTYGDH